MEEVDVSWRIKNSRRITDIFGYWPAFHDAEVRSVSLVSASGVPSEKEKDFPSLELKVHLWEMTDEVDASGYFVTTKHTLATLRFLEIDELHLVGFNFQNAIFALSIEPIMNEGQGPSVIQQSSLMRVEIEPAHGLSASFICQSMEVVSTEPYLPPGR